MHFINRTTQLLTDETTKLARLKTREILALAK